MIKTPPPAGAPPPYTSQQPTKEIPLTHQGTVDGWTSEGKPYTPQGQYGQPMPVPYGQPMPVPYGQPVPGPYGQPMPGVFAPLSSTVAIWNREPMVVQCQMCGNVGATRVSYFVGTEQWAIATLLCLFGLCLCCWGPFVIDDCKSMKHWCTRCGANLATKGAS